MGAHRTFAPRTTLHLLHPRPVAPHASRKVQAKTQLPENPRTGRLSRRGSQVRRQEIRSLLLRPETPRQPPSLRFSARAQRRPAVMGRPKGPSLDPGTKRLAMHVEDHPIEYGEFEGVIPEGYGAGIVMLWDRGTWTPEVDDVDAALKKGDLKFTLDGYKLKGSWVLVRTKGPSYGDGPKLAADQASRRLGRRCRHRGIRAAQREERRRLRRHPRRRHTGNLEITQAGQGRSDRDNAGGNYSEGGSEESWQERW